MPAHLLAFTVAIAPLLLLHPLAAAPASASGEAQGQARRLVIRVKDGGAKPEQFCMPTWSVANETGTDVGDLLAQIEWRKRSTGEVLQPVGQLGTMVPKLKAGVNKDMFVNGYQTACRDLQIVVRTYACRDTNAVRQKCPGPLVVQPSGTITADTSALAEGPMKGAVEARE